MAARPGREKRLYLIDGMPLVYRAYFVFLNRPLITANGFNSSAVYGYTTSLLQILNDEQPTHLAVVFDTPGPTWRDREYADYKGTRAKAPEDIGASLPHVRRITEAMGLSVIAHEGVEADDVIGTLAARAEAAGFDTYMVTLDKDFAQLVSDHVFLYRVPRMAGDPPQVYDVAGVRERFGVGRPEQVIDLIGLAGDSVDNIPGVPGVGEKTAQKLIARFGSVEALVAGSDQLKGKQREKIETHAAQALLSKRLATIDRDVDLELDLERLAVPAPDPQRVIPLFQEFEFSTLIERVFGDGEAAAAAAAAPAGGGVEGADRLRTLEDVAHDYRLVEGATARAALLQDLLQQEAVSLFAVCGGGDPKRVPLAGVAFRWQEGAAAYLPLPEARSAAAAELGELARFWEHPDIVKVGHDLKRWVTALRWHGIAVRGRLLDTRLAHQLVESEGAHDLALLAEHYLGYAPIVPGEAAAALLKSAALNAEELAAAGLPATELATYAGERADVTAHLLDALLREIDRYEERELWEQVEVPLMPLLVEMEHTGVAVRVDALRDYSLELEKEIAAHEADLYRLAGGPFNLNSPKQLGELLFGPPQDRGQAEAHPYRAVRDHRAGADPARRPPPDHPRHAGVPGGAEAEVDLRGRAARLGGGGYRAHPYHLQPARGRHRAAQLRKPQPAEHPHPHRQGARDPPRLRRAGTGPGAAGCRLLADRAAHHGGHHRRSRAGGGVRRRRGHPRRHLRPGVRRPVGWR